LAVMELLALDGLWQEHHSAIASSEGHEIKQEVHVPDDSHTDQPQAPQAKTTNDCIPARHKFHVVRTNALWQMHYHGTTKPQKPPGRPGAWLCARCLLALISLLSLPQRGRTRRLPQPRIVGESAGISGCLPVRSRMICDLPFSATQQEDAEAIKAVVQDVRSLSRAGSGAFGNVYRVETSTGVYAVKALPHRARKT
ncbi:unnamed protein product, partial [Symbiodinium sp. KB8]